MGGDCVYLSRDDVGLGVREPVADVARVLDRWVDGVVARVSSHESLELLSANMGVPVVNALSDLEHPCQAISDLLTIKEHRTVLAGQRVAFVGDGNNVAASLSVACASGWSGPRAGRAAGLSGTGPGLEAGRRARGDERVEG